MLKVSGKFYINPYLTKYEKNLRGVFWVSGQRERCTITNFARLENKEQNPFASENRANVYVTDVDIESKTAAPVLTTRLCFKVLVSQIDVPELQPPSMVQEESGKQATPSYNDVAIGTGSINVTEIAIKHAKNNSANVSAAGKFYRPGNNGPSKGGYVYVAHYDDLELNTLRTKTIPSLGGIKRVEATLSSTLDDDKRATAAVMRWTDTEFVATMKFDHLNENIRRSVHGKYDISDTIYTMPEMYYIPRTKPYSEEIYLRLLDAALFATNVDKALLLSIIESGNAAAIRLVACRVLARMICYLPECTTYVPDYMLRTERTNWSLSTTVVSKSLDKGTFVDACDIYEDPCLTGFGDCEEAGRLMVAAAFFLSFRATPFTDKCLQALACLADQYVFGASIVTTRDPCAEQMSAGITTEGIESQDTCAHVMTVAIPLHLAIKMLSNGARMRRQERPGLSAVYTKETKDPVYMKNLRDKLSGLAEHLPVLSLEGTGIGDPLCYQASLDLKYYKALEEVPQYNPFGKTTETGYDAVQYEIAKKVNRVYPLSKGNILGEVRDYSGVGEKKPVYNHLVRFVSWDFSAKCSGVGKNARFNFASTRTGKIGLPFAELMRAETSCSIVTTGEEMPQSIFDQSLRLLSRCEVVCPLEATDVPKEDVFTHTLYEDVGKSQHKITGLVALKKRNLNATAEGVLRKIQKAENLEIAVHHIYINNLFQFALVKLWKK